MKENKKESFTAFLQTSIIIGISIILILIILESLLPYKRATVIKDMGFFIVVEYQDTLYIINKDECERGIKIYDSNYVYIRPETALDKNNKIGEN